MAVIRAPCSGGSRLEQRPIDGDLDIVGDEPPQHRLGVGFVLGGDAALAGSRSEAGSSGTSSSTVARCKAAGFRRTTCECRAYPL